jgi:hypothetical protein
LPLGGRRLLIWAEQGVGDEVMFASLVPDVLAAGGRPVILCNSRLVPLFARSFPAAQVLHCSDPGHFCQLPADCHVPMGSLPRFFRSAQDRFLPHRGYLRPDDTLVEHLRARYASLGSGLKVGISWRSGNRTSGRRRSAPLSSWRELLQTDGVQFVNVQYGDCRQELDDVKRDSGVEVYHDEQVDPLRDMDAFAAQIAALDLVISIDNSTVHMAGALGKPVWTLLSVAPNWRWFHGRDDSPWYPAMRLFRQTKLADWPALFQHVAAALAAWKATRF